MVERVWGKGAYTAIVSKNKLWGELKKGRKKKHIVNADGDKSAEEVVVSVGAGMKGVETWV